MPSKSCSMLKKQILIKEELRNFPVLGPESKSLKMSQITHKTNSSLGRSESKKKLGLQRGRSMEAEPCKVLQSSISNFKKSRDKLAKSSALVKKKRNRNAKE